MYQRCILLSLHRWGGFRVLCSKHVLMDLESMLEKCASMKPYSEDLRVRIVRAVEEGMSKSAAARLFGVSLSSVNRYARIAQRGESLMPRRGGGRPPRRMRSPGEAARREVRELVEGAVCALLYLPLYLPDVLGGRELHLLIEPASSQAISR
jgi:transposase-like protein